MEHNIDRHQKRADDMGDSMRRYLIGVNAGGIAVLAALSDRQANGPLPVWVAVPCIFFVAGLTLTGWSIALQKHKALKHLEAARSGSSTPPKFDGPGFRNQFWDIGSFMLFLAGALFFFFVPP